MPKKFFSLTVKLAVFFLLMGTATLLASSYFGYTQGADLLEERLELQLEGILALKEDSLDAFLHTEVEDMEGIANTTYMRQELDELAQLPNDDPRRNVLQKDLIEFLDGRIYEDFTEFAILGMDGGIIASTDRAQIGKNKANNPYFVEGKKASYIKGIYFSKTLNKPALSISVPLTNLEGKLIGVLVGRVELGEISKIMEQETGIGETGETYLVAGDYLAVSRLRIEKSPSFSKKVQTRGTENCIANGEGHNHYLNYHGSEVLGRYKWLDQLDACLLVEIHTEEAFSQYSKLAIDIFLMDLFILAIITLLAVAFARTITRPIEKLRKSAKIIGSGKLGHRLDIRTGDEIEEVGNAFNEMASRLEGLTGNLEKKVKERTLDLEEANERLKEIDREKDLFFNMVSHELITPMVPIRGYSEMLQKQKMGKLNESQKETLEIIVRNTDRLANMVNDILDFSRINAGRLKLNTENLLIDRAIKNTINDMMPLAKAKNIALKMKKKKAMPMLKADPLRIGQVLSNLVKNAIKFTPNNGKITVWATENGNDVVVAIKDTGIGIAKQNIPKLFTKYYQVKTAKEGAPEGLGLGLAISRGIIGAHNGKIWIESVLGKGSTVYFSLPIYRAKGNAKGKGQ